MGSSYVGADYKKDNPPDGGKQPRIVEVKAFWLDEHAVTNEQFIDFINDTGYETDADKFGWSFVLAYFASEETTIKADNDMGRIEGDPSWLGVREATWEHPLGPDSDVEDILDHPVVQVSWNDARAYCKWAGRRLAREKEWEYAARSGLVGQPFPWGKEATPQQLNYWQGDFPLKNNVEDGYAGTAPVKSFEPNSFGFYNMVGNVWEWVGGGSKEKRILKGGSFIDSIDASFNHPALVSTRQLTTADSGNMNTGFRCASDAEVDDNEEIIDLSESKPPKKEL